MRRPDLEDVPGTNPPGELTKDELELVTRAAFGRDLRPTPQRLQGGLSNTLVQLTFPGFRDSFVLRLYRRGKRVAATEVALLRLLAGRMPVSEVVYADTAGDLVGRPLAILRFVDGVLLDRVLAEGDGGDVAQAADAVGAALASIGQVELECGGFFSGADLVPEPEPSIGSAGLLPFVRAHLWEGRGREALDEGTRERYWALLERAAPKLDAVKGARSLVHADFNGKNIVMTREEEIWQVAAVLDWEFAFSGTPLFDIGNMLRLTDSQPSEFEPSFIGGYRSNGGVLPPHWREIVRLLDVYPLCQFLARGPEALFYEHARRIVMAAVERGSIWP